MRWLLFQILACPLVAHAGDQKDEYKLRDDARLAIADAVNKHDPRAFATYVDKPLELSAMWFDTAPCRDKFSHATVAVADIPALLDCLSPLGMDGKALLVRYGPDVVVRLGLKYADGRVTLESLEGDGMVKEAEYPAVWIEAFEQHRKAGSRAITFDAKARAEIEQTGDQGVIYEVCVDSKGMVSKTGVMMLAPDGPAARAIRASTKAWRFAPFLVRGKPTTACAVETAKLANR
jgi:hypothetical protein